MEAKQFEVEVVYQQRTRYLVEASNDEEAERLALEKWQNEEEEEELLNEECCEEVVSVAAQEVADAERAEEDQAVALRFLRDRELVIEQLDSDLFNPTIHDAVSAEDVALRLKWMRPTANGAPVPDIPRAARALEALCRNHLVVCFTRPRVRRGERGEIRLYCTPQHLEQLAARLEDRVDEPEQPAEAGEPQEAGAEAS